MISIKEKIRKFLGIENDLDKIYSEIKDLIKILDKELGLDKKDRSIGNDLAIIRYKKLGILK